LALIPLLGQAYAQFNSGSTGADGPLDLSTCGTAICTVQIRDEPNHVFNYTTINIPSGKTLKFLPNAQNSPVILLASGNVALSGIIDVSGAPGNSTTIGGGRVAGIGGPGAYHGGGGGFSVTPFFNGNSGGGPGGGSGAGTPTQSSSNFGGGGAFLNNTTGALAYGTQTLVPLIGGSGGGGGQGASSTRGCGGGGGGGAILIASSGTITFTSAGGGSQVLAVGGAGNNGTVCANTFANGGPGSGGAVRLIATTMTGPVTINVSPGATGQQSGSPGRVRIEVTNASGLSPTVNPNSVGVLSLATPNPVFPTAIPRLSITSVGGQAVNNPSNSPHGVTPDLTIPQTLPNPVVVGIAGQNVPVGTFVRLIISPQFGSSSDTKGVPLTGTQASSTATETVTLPSGLTYITAVAEFDVGSPLSGYSPTYVNGEKVQKMRVSAGMNGQSEVIYILASGKEVKAER